MRPPAGEEMGLLLVPEAVGLQLLLNGNSAVSGIIARAACTVVGVAYPIYASFKSIEARREDPHRLAYWSVFGLTTLAEGLLDQSLTAWLPWYYHAKLLLLLWLQLPNTQGARRLYLRLLRPFLLRHQQSIEMFMRRLRLLGRSPEVMALSSLWRSCVAVVPGLRAIFVDQPEESDRGGDEQRQQHGHGLLPPGHRPGDEDDLSSS